MALICFWLLSGSEKARAPPQQFQPGIRRPPEAADDLLSHVRNNSKPSTMR
jgi:hypothetical protein